ncbi:hypothetical protein RHGRI_030721 [Rhododendron griersonianum]|uniref:CCHC-type domain-containing protein n=1 Tax=Rhododendron griersonianum TaxID=479676 RepID=A0AAV6I7S0_9ERIC|nr:hypothetical protein RHGRI_030721 [Rhododendron griersonianum]
MENNDVPEGAQPSQPSVDKMKRGESSSNISGIQPCPKCGRMHKSRCYHETGACYKCGEMGHLMRDSPTISSRSTSKPTVNTNSGQSSGTKTEPEKRQDGVLALAQEEPQNVDLVVSGTIQICGNLAKILTDLRSKYSFVSALLANELTVSLDYLNMNCICYSQQVVVLYALLFSTHIVY